MKNLLYIFFFTSLLMSVALNAQTPYDSFAPESTRPMIEREALHQDGCMQTEEPSSDTVLCVAVVDMQQQTLLLINIYDNTIIGSTPLSDDILKWLSVDPLADKNIATSPYMYCNGNPIIFIDPDGRDWYEADGEIKWTELKSQQAMDEAKLAGRYLGEAVVIFNGYRDETLGEGNNLWGDGAKLATAIVYGPGGCDDIVTYDAFTMSSDFNEYGAIKDGDYSLDYINETGPMGTHWTINNRGVVDCVDGINYAWYKHKETNPYSATQKNRTYVHRCNLNGDMLPKDKYGKYHPLSTGCLIIAPSKKGISGWIEYNSQLQGIKKAFLRITRQ